MLTSSAPASVKSDRPRRPGSCFCRKMISRSGPCFAFQPRTRRSSVRRTPWCSSGWRRIISSYSATARSPGLASSSGTISPSKIPASGSGRLRPLGFLFSDDRPGSASIRYAVAVLNPALAAASAGRSFFR